MCMQSASRHAYNTRQLISTVVVDAMDDHCALSKPPHKHKPRTHIKIMTRSERSLSNAKDISND